MTTNRRQPRAGSLGSLVMLMLTLAAGTLATPPIAARIPGILHITDSTRDKSYRAVDIDDSGLIEAGEILESFAGPLSTPSHLAIWSNGGILLLDGGSEDRILLLEDRDGDGVHAEDEVSLFYASSDGPVPIFTPNTLLVMPDGSLLVADDSTRAKRLVAIRSATEAVIVANDLEDPEALALLPDGSLLVSNTSAGSVLRLSDVDGDGDYDDAGERNDYYLSADPNALTDIDTIVVDPRGRAFVFDQDSGLVIWLEDTNGDGDATDAGESGVFYDATGPVRVGAPNDAVLVPDHGIYIVSGASDAIYFMSDANGDGDAFDDGEVFRVSASDDETLSNPTAIVFVSDEDPEPETPDFVRGDTNLDDRVDLSDAVAVLDFLFGGRPAPACADAGDADDSGDLNITDAIYLLNFLFLGGTAPPDPFPEPGTDPSDDALDCGAAS